MRPIYKNIEQKEKQNKKHNFCCFSKNKFLWYHVVILTQTDDPTVLFFWGGSPLSPVVPFLDGQVVDRWVALPHAQRFVLKQF